MSFSRIIGIVLIAALLIGCGVLFLMRSDATRLSDKNALEEALATPEPTPTPEGGLPAIPSVSTFPNSWPTWT